MFARVEALDGVVREVSEQEILDAKAQVGAGGFGCEPASAASVAGLKQLVAEGVIGRDERGLHSYRTSIERSDRDCGLSHNRSGPVQ